MAARLAGKIALITGAGAGIGEAIAERFAREGATVWVTGRHAENTAAVVERLRQQGHPATARQLDVADPDAEARTVAEVVAEAGRLDVMVANAALAGAAAYLGPLTEITDAQWQRVIDVNLSGVFYCAREAARVMIGQGSGCIITVGSVNSFVPEADVPAYAASKGRVLMLTRSLARDLGQHGIRVNGIAPGGTDTANMTAAIERLGLSRDDLVGRIPLGRRADPVEIAAVAVFLASDDASFVHGQMLVADGGQLCT